MKLIEYLPLSNIDKLYIKVTNCCKTLAQVYNEVKAQYPKQEVYIINGGMWNPDGSPCRGLKVDGKLLSLTPWNNIPGFGWNTPTDVAMTTNWQKYNTYIACSQLLQNGVKVGISYGSAQGGKRGRTAIGLKNNQLMLYCSQDGDTTTTATPEQLQTELYNQGVTEAIMLDSGGSSMCNFNGSIIKGDGRKVDNWIVVVMKQSETTPVPPVVDNGNKIIPNYITNNIRYTNQIHIAKKRMMLHSTGTPGASASAIRNNMNKASSEESVEFIIDDTGVYQLLPLNIKSHHCGGSGNNTHVGCEICEPIQTRLIKENWKPLMRNGKNNTTWAVTQLQKELQAWGYDPKGIDGNFGPGCEAAVKAFQRDNGLSADGSVGPATKAKLETRNGSYLKYNPNDPEVKKYFNNVYNKAVWLFATVLKQIGGKADEIVSHAEGYQQGIASNHADVGHWFPLHGKTMDVFRADVEKAMSETNMPSDTDSPADWAKEYWAKAIKKNIIDGTRPYDEITRQETMVILGRLGLLD